MVIALARTALRAWRESSSDLTRGLALGFFGAVLAVSFQAFLATSLEVRTIALYLWLFGALIFTLAKREKIAVIGWRRSFMKIVLANKYYFLKGGAERYLFELKSLLERNGHETIPFAMAGAKNELSPWSKHFVSPVADRAHLIFAVGHQDRRPLHLFV